MDDLEKEKAHLKTAITKADVQLATLVEKRKTAEAGNQADIADYERVREFYNKGMAPNTRLTESRRAVLLSATQVLQTITDTSQVERVRGDYNRQLDKTDDQR